MSAFEPAVAVVLKHEGGFVDDPDDRGGATNFGISTLIIKNEGITAEELGLADLSPASIRMMKVGAAAGIYQRRFWAKYGYARIASQTVATKVFDCAVNCGPARAHLLVQQAAIVCGQELALDGVLGAMTIAALNACNPIDLVQAFGEQMADYYRAIVSRNPKQVKFLHNWLKRAAWPGLTLKNVRQEPR